MIKNWKENNFLILIVYKLDFNENLYTKSILIYCIFYFKSSSFDS